MKYTDSDRELIDFRTEEKSLGLAVVLYTKGLF